MLFAAIHDKGDLFNYHFHSEIWGSESDWMMVFVTGFTAYYLIKSFKAQVINNNIQSKILKNRRKLTMKLKG
jgi:hypothetical protein